MSDLRLTWNVHAADLSIAANDLAIDEGLETAVILSLFTDRRAAEGDVLPDDQTDRRGWWGDDGSDVPGDLIGSRLWLLAREKEQAIVLRRAREYAREALQWLIDDRVAAAVDVTAAIPRPGVLGLLIVITRPLRPPVEYRFHAVWAGQAARAA
jgi:phage gp46-like protein